MPTVIFEWNPGGGAADTEKFTVDAVLTRTVRMTAEVTRFPVERGCDISDNARLQPVELSYSCFVSNTPVDLATTRQAQHDTYYTGPGLGSNRGKQAYDRLVSDVFEEKRLVDVWFGKGAEGEAETLYDSVLITDISIDNGKGRTGGFWFDVSFRRVRFVSSLVTDVLDVPQVPGIDPEVQAFIDFAKVSLQAADAALEQAQRDKQVEQLRESGDFHQVAALELKWAAEGILERYE